MNPLVLEAVGAVVRWGLALLAGYLVDHRIWTAEQSERYVGAAALAVVPILWSLYRKYKNRLKLLAALSTPQVISESKLESNIKAFGAPAVTTPKDEVPQ